MIKLVQLSLNDGKNEYEMLQRIGAKEGGFKNDAYGLSFEQFKDWLAEKDAWSKGDDLPEGYVRQWVFWLKEDDYPIGIGKIREKLTERSRKWGGTIGYAISPEHRNRGYGKVLLRELVNWTRENGISEIITTVYKDNSHSVRINVCNGGQIIKEDDRMIWFGY